jgi:hypothetical protein
VNSYTVQHHALVELSVTELKYLAKMNGESIFVMQGLGKKNNSVFPDLQLAEAIQAKFAAVLPDGVPELFTESPAQTRRMQRGRQVPGQACESRDAFGPPC